MGSQAKEREVRRRRVRELVAAGWTNGRIAAELGVAYSTIVADKATVGVVGVPVEEWGPLEPVNDRMRIRLAVSERLRSGERRACPRQRDYVGEVLEFLRTNPGSSCFDVASGVRCGRYVARTALAAAATAGRAAQAPMEIRDRRGRKRIRPRWFLVHADVGTETRHDDRQGTTTAPCPYCRRAEPPEPRRGSARPRGRGHDA
jgi:hypothetical protein